GAVARLRVALAGAQAAPSETVAPWDVTVRRVEAFAGRLPQDFEQSLESAHAALRAKLVPLLPKASTERAAIVERAVAKLSVSDDECREPGSPPISSPGERRALCALLRAAREDDVAYMLAVDLALDVGRWA